MESFQVSLNNFLILFFSGSSSLLLIRSNSVSTEDVTVVSSACNLSGPSETSFNCFCKFSTSLQSSSLSKMCAIFFFFDQSPSCSQCKFQPTCWCRRRGMCSWKQHWASLGIGSIHLPCPLTLAVLLVTIGSTAQFWEGLQTDFLTTFDWNAALSSHVAEAEEIGLSILVLTLFLAV